MQHWNIRVTGRVQGVFYRQSTVRVARELGLNGYAANEPDGSVLIEAEGPVAALDQLAAWCRIGPPSARVDQVITAIGPVAGHHGFEIRR